MLENEDGETYVADAYGLGLARCEGGLHLLPAVDVVVVVDDISLAAG